MSPTPFVEPAAIAGLLGRSNRRWSTPDGARGVCSDASFRLQFALHQRGHTGAELIVATWPEHGDHHAVLLDGQVYDMTVRQFDPDQPWPLIVPRAEWEALMVRVAPEGVATVVEVER